MTSNPRNKTSKFHMHDARIGDYVSKTACGLVGQHTSETDAGKFLQMFERGRVDRSGEQTMCQKCERVLAARARKEPRTGDRR